MGNNWKETGQVQVMPDLSDMPWAHSARLGLRNCKGMKNASGWWEDITTMSKLVKAGGPGRCLWQMGGNLSWAVAAGVDTRAPKNKADRLDQAGRWRKREDLSTGTEGFERIERICQKRKGEYCRSRQVSGQVSQKTEPEVKPKGYWIWGAVIPGWREGGEGRRGRERGKASPTRCRAVLPLFHKERDLAALCHTEGQSRCLGTVPWSQKGRGSVECTPPILSHAGSVSHGL